MGTRRLATKLRCEILESRHLLASVAFVEQPAITGHEAIGLVHAADLDSDGDMDIVSASEAKLVWYRNIDGHGELGPAIVIHDAAQQSRGSGVFVEAADVDGDGDRDIIWSYFNGLVWFENVEGSGVFSERRSINEMSGHLVSASIADLDGDGDVDVVATFIDERSIVWFENTDGEGRFGRSHHVANDLAYAHTVFPADMDGDGDTDLIVSDVEGNHVHWFSNVDDGTFVQTPFPISVPGPAWIAAADIDHDGDTDVVVSSHGEFRVANLYWLENTSGLGDLGAQHHITNAAGPLAVRDVDGDTDLDIVLGSGQRHGTVTWYQNSGQADAFVPRTVYGGTYFVRAIDVADIDSDGIVDVLWTTKDEGTVSWSRHRLESGDFSSPHRLATRAFNVSSIVAADLDGDGDDDVVSASSLDKKVAWYENLNGGGFHIERGISVGLAGEESTFVIDVDGDGDNDVISAASDDERIAWFENTDGLGNFSPQVVSVPAREAEVVAAADLDGDGDADLLSASSEDDEVLWFRNLDRQGTYGEPILIGSVQSVTDVLAVDLDQDGDLDVLGISKHLAFWFENSNGHFGDRRLITDSLEYGMDLLAIDIDGDGDLDVVTGAEGDRGHGRGVAWYENIDGEEVFGVPQTIASSGEFVFAADFDSDGDVDLVSAGGRTAHFHENIDSLGGFAAPQLITNRMLSASAIIGSDFDEDGNIDVLIADRHRGRISWFANRVPGDSNGDGQFDSADLVLVFTAGEYEDEVDDNSTFDEGDWDGDGDFTTSDLVFAFRSNRFVAALPRLAVADAASTTDGKHFERKTDHVFKYSPRLGPAAAVDLLAVLDDSLLSACLDGVAEEEDLVEL